ncbi:MAG: PorV/PorQ family protein [candidate division Zixibacteria bacterium]
MKRLFCRYHLLIALISVFSHCAAWGADNGQTAAGFLTIGVDARSTALAGALTSASDDATASFWNPAGLANVNSIQLICSHQSWYQDISFEYAAAAMPLNEEITISVSFAFLSYGEITGYDISDNPTGDINSTYDFAGGISLGYRILDKLTIGLTAKHIIVSLAGIKASANAFDFGLRLNSQIGSIGITAANIGTDLIFREKQNKLPALIRAGFSIKPSGQSLILVSEVDFPFYNRVKYKNGIELSFSDHYFLRAGYGISQDNNAENMAGGYSLGGGLRLGSSHLDYSFSPGISITSEYLHQFTVRFQL